ncbi:hypothetical protein ACFLZX_04130 [Nanoarchaeota archaeon]
MEKYEEYRTKAVEKIKVADHMLTVTFPMVKDPRMLPVILQNVFLGVSYGIQSVLAFERLYKRVPMYADDFKSRLEMFRSRCVDRMKFNKEIVNKAREIRQILLKHQKSKTEFAKEDCFVICSDDYNTIKITEKMIGQYLYLAKGFVHDAAFKVRRK